MGRDNETWVAQLRSDGSVQQAALSDLREVLLRGLRRAFSNRPPADNSFLEDAAQDSLIRILDRLGQFEGRSRFLTWATAIAVHVTMSELRRRRWKDVSLETAIADADFVTERAVDSDAGPDMQLAQKAILNEMQNVIQNELTDKQRTALLAEMRGIPQDEIARHLGSNRNAVYKLTHDARKRLRRGLERAGYDADDIDTAFVN